MVGGRPQPGARRDLGRGNRRRQLQDAVEVRCAETGTPPPARRPPPTNSASISSLVNGTQYSVRVHAINATGDGAWSTIVTGTPNEPELTVTGIAGYSATLNMGNYGGTWHYKHTTPSNGTCSTAQTGKTATPSLNQNTNVHLLGVQRQHLHDAAGQRALIPQPSRASRTGINVQSGVNRSSKRAGTDCRALPNTDSSGSAAPRIGTTMARIWMNAATNKNAGREVRDCTLEQNQGRHIVENLASDVTCSVRVAGKNASGLRRVVGRANRDAERHDLDRQQHQGDDPDADGRQ